MNRYLLSEPTSGDAARVPIDSRVGVYRLGDGSKTVVAEADGQQVDLGVRDATVSRKTDGRSPIELSPISRGISVRNHGNTNPVSLSTNLRTHTLTAGDAAAITDDCRLTVGISLTLQAIVERASGQQDGRPEQQPEGVQPAAHARALANALRAASDDSTAEARRVITELQAFLETHPRQGDAYKTVHKRVNHIKRRLDTKADGLHQTERLDEEWQAELTAVSDRIEGLYARTSG